ncbi:MAG TPA: low-specificity L-threonine aldolase [Aggregatilineaceae bacterium]|nr:low-specificity L-threonine aldolase [Aggregatilineaceae bacterium]
MDRIDLRSDTVTWPTPEMREAMATAVVGDDVFGEDPTVNRLQDEAAKRLGKEAGLLVSSGTMGNLVAVLTHCGRGDEAILGDKAHTFVYEAGGIAALGGVNPHTVPVQSDGTLRLDDIRHAIRPDNVHMPRTRLIALENTQGTVGGIPLPKAYIDAVGEIARENELALHIDGARIFNAATAVQCDVAELVEAADSISFCLSKGLCASVGSVLVGTQAFIEEARRVRKMLGGGMRQAGVLAAAGLIALEKMTQRLGEDHANARRLAEGIARIPQFEIDLTRVQTNMVFFQVHEDAGIMAPEMAERLAARNIWIMDMGEYRFRAVTHYWISTEHIEMVLRALVEELP